MKEIMEKTSPIEKNAEYYGNLADKLSEEQEKINNGRGKEHVNYIISSLKKGNIKEAKIDCFNQSDKFDSCPKIKEIIINELFDEGEEHPWSIMEKLKKGQI